MYGQCTKTGVQILKKNKRTDIVSIILCLFLDNGMFLICLEHVVWQPLFGGYIENTNALYTD